MENIDRRTGNFPSRKDNWLIVVLSVTAVVEVIAAVVLFIVGTGSLWSGGVVPLLLLASAVVIVGSLIGTKYRVAGPDLLIRSGLFRTRVPITSIASVAPTHNVNAALALSATRLDLSCTNPARHVLVSPMDSEAFIAALKVVNPAITVVGGGSAHA